MEKIDWTILIVIVLFNMLYCLAQYMAQRFDRLNGRIPERGSIIPSTKQSFLYWQDFYAQTFGDFLGLPGIIYGYYSVVINHPIHWLLFLFIAMMVAASFAASCLSSEHKPDWGFPGNGRISVGGVVHLFYFGTLGAMGVSCIVFIISGFLTGWTLGITLIGGGIWLIAGALDIKAGHFEKLKKI